MINIFRTFSSKCSQVSSMLPSILTSQAPTLGRNLFSTLNLPRSNFLAPKCVSIVPCCGLKIKGKIRLRCKDCYFVRREGRLYVMCRSFPRHKQTHLVRAEKFTWMLTHACMSKQRPY